MAQIGIVAMALASSAAAALLPFLQREDRRFPLGADRRALFGILLLDASIQWVLLARIDQGAAGPAWVASLLLSAIANIGLGLALFARGYTLPPFVRWGGTVMLLIVEPAFHLAMIYFLNASAGA